MYNLFVKKQITLKIKSSGRNEKEVILEKNGFVLKKQFSGDALTYIQKFLKEQGLKITDLEKIIPVKSDSFTGYREAVVIANVFNGMYKNSHLKDLDIAQYHKEPNIG